MSFTVKLTLDVNLLKRNWNLIKFYPAHCFQKRFITELVFLRLWCNGMCEFKVILDGEIVFKDAIYAKMESNNVIVRDVLGESKEFKNCKIIEVDVNSTRLVLSSV